MAHTTGGSEKPTEESARERGLGVGVGRDSRYGSIYVCPPSPSFFFFNPKGGKVGEWSLSPKPRVRDVVGPSPAAARVERCVNVSTDSLVARLNGSSAPCVATQSV